MIETYPQYPCDYIFNEDRDSGKSPHLYAEDFTESEDHFSDEQQKRGGSTTSKMNESSRENNTLKRNLYKKTKAKLLGL